MMRVCHRRYLGPVDLPRPKSDVAQNSLGTRPRGNVIKCIAQEAVELMAQLGFLRYQLMVCTTDSSKRGTREHCEARGLDFFRKFFINPTFLHRLAACQLRRIMRWKARATTHLRKLWSNRLWNGAKKWSQRPHSATSSVRRPILRQRNHPADMGLDVGPRHLAA